MNATIFNDMVTWHFNRDKLHCDAGKIRDQKALPIQSDENPTEILVPMDFSASALNALQTAVCFARKHGARITLLYVVDVNLCPTYRVDITRIEHGIVAEAEKNFTRIIQPLSASARFATRIVKGRPFEQILDVARAHGIKLIIMGKKQPRRFWNLFCRNTAMRVMEKAACDVIVVAEQNKTQAPILTFKLPQPFGALASCANPKCHNYRTDPLEFHLAVY